MAREVAGHRRRVDDVTVAVCHQVGEERLVAVDHAPEVHAHHPLPVVATNLVGTGPDAAADAGVVADDVDPLEGVDR